MIPFSVSVLRSTPNHTPLQYRCLTKISYIIGPAYFMNNVNLVQIERVNCHHSLLPKRGQSRERCGCRLDMNLGEGDYK